MFYDLFLADSMDQFVENYITREYNSQGAAIRVAMNLVPATVFLATQKQFSYLPWDEKIWRNFSLAAWMFLVMLLVSPSSTAVDRLALYVIPLQLAVLSRIPRAFNGSALLRLAVMVYSGSVLFVWLNFAKHADYWLPYHINFDSGACDIYYLVTAYGGHPAPSPLSRASYGDEVRQNARSGNDFVILDAREQW